MDIEVYSFFSGLGFMDLGFEDAGFDIVFANENNKMFLEAYNMLGEIKYINVNMDIVMKMLGSI